MNIEICFQEEVDSTNLYAKRMAKEGAPEGTLALADAQTAGRGRRGRNWDSPKGESIYMSLLLRPKILPEYASQLTLVMGLSVAEGVADVLQLPVQIKWPNDVVVDGKKICGILTEMSADMDGIHYIVIGVGINVNNQEFPEELKTVATSLRMVTGEMQDRQIIMQGVLDAFSRNYERFLETENLGGLTEAYNRILANRDHQVRVLDPKNPFEGIARGINEYGELLVERQDGEIIAVYAGEVSVRGLYSYV